MIDEITCRPSKAAKMLGISKSKMYELLNRSDCDYAFMLDGCRLVSIPKLNAWIERKIVEQCEMKENKKSFPDYNNGT